MVRAPKVSEPLNRALAAVGDVSGIVHIAGVQGGCISEARCVQTKTRSYFLKTGRHGAFHAEAHGLRLLRESGSLDVPSVLAVDDDFLLLEWITCRSETDFAALGRGLAALHEVTRATYGLERDNFIGASPQVNTQETDWVLFFGHHRLLEQARLARHRGYWSSSRESKLNRLVERLGDFLPEQPPSSLLHGDLWRGNILSAADGKPVIIDPAVYFGDRETDLAFSRLFGGLPPVFYDAYAETWPLETNWEDRLDVYNLYHLLNHLNLFGEGYGSDVDRILSKLGT